MMKRILRLIVLTAMIGAVTGCGASQSQQGGKKWTEGPMPAGGNFDGVYQSDFGRLELNVTGDRVVGLYENDMYNGRIEGEIDDNILEFNWTQWNQEMRGKVRETKGEGVFQYVVESVGVGASTSEYHRLEGWWGYTGKPLSNRWNAAKLSHRAKKKLKPFIPEPNEMQAGDSYEAAEGFTETSTPSMSDESDDEDEDEDEDVDNSDLF
ncbi:MAG: hypothetical protein QNJ97_04835 [Myxococcota bacterium]|nr:hypothetical protein [Myxococcota bacterium]